MVVLCRVTDIQLDRIHLQSLTHWGETGEKKKEVQRERERMQLSESLLNLISQCNYTYYMLLKPVLFYQVNSSALLSSFLSFPNFPFPSSNPHHECMYSNHLLCCVPNLDCTVQLYTTDSQILIVLCSCILTTNSHQPLRPHTLSKLHQVICWQQLQCHVTQIRWQPTNGKAGIGSRDVVVY